MRWNLGIDPEENERKTEDHHQDQSISQVNRRRRGGSPAIRSMSRPLVYAFSSSGSGSKCPSRIASDGTPSQRSRTVA